MRRISLLAVGILAAGLAAAVAGASTKGTTLSLVGYSTPKTVMGKIIQLWQQTPDGKDVSFTTSYGPSGDQARAVAAGLKADIVFLSTGLDVNTLVDAGLVDQNWTKQSYGGSEADSVVVFAFRGGNPKHIKTWNDLLRPGVQVVTPNPFTSGGARWNVMAAYGSWRKQGKTDKHAQQNMLRLSQDSSSRNATNTFLAGKGDVLLTYESEAIAAQQAGQSIGFLVPHQTMLIELPIVALKGSSNLDAANRFIAFTKTPPAQDLLAQYGFRPVNKQAAKKYRSKFPVRNMVRIDDPIFGGWRKVDKRWFDPHGGLMVGIEKAIGGPTG